MKSTPSTKPHLRIGFIELIDCAPLLTAQELGFFEKEGIRVELSREVGWATIRQKVLYHQIDAAHAVAGLAMSLRLGLDGIECPAIAPFVFNLHGHAITLSLDLWRRGVRDAATLKKLIRSSRQRLYTLGIVARSASHNFLLRQWLRSGGIDPDRDVRLVVLPPTQMAGALKEGLIDGFSAGEPWNSSAVVAGAGWCPVTSAELAPHHPEKILLTTEPFAEQQPEILSAVIRALGEACAWCDVPENRPALVKLLTKTPHFHMEAEVLKRSLIGPFQDGTGQSRDARDFYIFHRDHANEPTRDRGEWLVDQFCASGLVPADQRPHVYRTMLSSWRGDLYHQALAHERPTSQPRPRRAAKVTSTAPASA